MSEQYSNEPMLDMYIFETYQNIEQLEQAVLSSEKAGGFSEEAINEIFRIMHTIKGSSAMMLFDNISALAHSMEDLFFFLRKQLQQAFDFSALSDLIFEGADFIKIELHKLKNGNSADGDSSRLITDIRALLQLLRQDAPPGNTPGKKASAEKPSCSLTFSRSLESTDNNLFKATLFFVEGCEMENIRAYSIVHHLGEFTDKLRYFPEDIMDNDDSAAVIREKGFTVYAEVDRSYEEMRHFFEKTLFLRDLELIQLDGCPDFMTFSNAGHSVQEDTGIKVEKSIDSEAYSFATQSIISVSVEKLDRLMDLAGEMVIAEAMVTQNPEFNALQSERLFKSARQLHKITGELQDMVMSIRMVPLSTTFQKMHRIVRDMCKKLGKEVNLELIGERTEVDKNIIEHISDPLIHLVRNAVDHGIGSTEERMSKGKPKSGTITLEAKNSGSDVLIIVRDDGKGLNKAKILERAAENGLLVKPFNEMTDKEIYSLIMLPGFSTKDSVTEYSGRGVGMDVVTRNMEFIGGSVSVDSTEGEGTSFTMKIPLTLAIIDGMNIRVGLSRFTIPTIAIKESFRPKESDIINDTDGNEIIMVRGQCYPILRLHEYYDVKTNITEFPEGILIMAEQDGKTICIFADELLGQQQIVVKALPNYIKKVRKIQGLTGCTLLGDGSISLILDINSLIA